MWIDLFILHYVSKVVIYLVESMWQIRVNNNIYPKVELFRILQSDFRLVIVLVNSVDYRQIYTHTYHII